MKPNESSAGKPAVRVVELQRAATRIWAKTPKDDALGVRAATEWKITLSPPLPAAWPHERGGHWIRYVWALGPHTSPGYQASEPFAKFVFVPGEDAGVLVPLSQRIGRGGFLAIRPGTMAGNWVLNDDEKKAAEAFPARADFDPTRGLVVQDMQKLPRREVFAKFAPEAMVFARRWRGWLWHHTEFPAFLKKHHAAFEAWVHEAAPPR